MKNLKLLTDVEFDLELQSQQESILFSAVDIERNRVFFGSSENFLYALQLPSLQKDGPWSMYQLSPEAQLIDLEPGDCITSMDYLMEKEAVIMGTLNGHLLLHNVDDNTAEVVGRVEGGVKSIASSPDGALLAVTAGLGQILVMTHDWEVLYETMMPELDNPIPADATNGSSNYQFECSISWRGDAKYFATLSRVHNSSSPQKLRIWERDSGSLHAASEFKAFMGASLDWMPSGAKVAVVYDRRADKKCPSIVFFERNGLERSAFSIDEPIDAMVEILKWNCASDLLAAVVAFEEYDAIKIWSFSNNHWYLKQEIRHSKKDAVKFMWDPTRPLQLICWTLSGKIISYNFVWTTAVTENSTALVIDNSYILVTPLGLSLVPPPMSLFRLKFPNAVQNVSFFSNNSKNLLAASLSNGYLCVVELPPIETWEQFESKELRVEACHSNIELGTLRHLVWLESHILLCVSHHKGISESDFSYQEKVVKNYSGYYFQEIELLHSENSIPGSVAASGWHAKISKCLPFEKPVIGIAANPVRKFSAFVQFFGGSIAEYSLISDIEVTTGVPCLQELGSEMGFSSSCPWMSAVPVFDDDRLKSLIFGLDGSGKLHVSGRVLCYNCSSFAFYSNTTGVKQQATTHLILTTKQDILFIVRINDILLQNQDMNFDNWNQGGLKKSREDHGDSIYIWERGAKLVSVIHGDEAAVILQTSRGNLECIYPRKLVLFSIVNALVQTRFKDAILMVRRHRIDFNVIVDYCGWQAFLQCADEFVRQVDNLGHITEFICSIKNENVIETLYKNVIALPCPNQSKVSRLDERSKVSSVLLAIRKALEEKSAESPARELCILTTLARSQPPALEEALKRIKVIREMELSGFDTSRRKSYPSAEEALKHLLWLSDSEGVYAAALGLYDLNLAAIVALNSQKDPKEFLPFLQGLECIPPVIMQYKIDLRLHRYESALKHIFSAGEAHHEECMNLMKSNPQLFPLGLQLYADNHKRSQVLEAWGDHLFSEKCFDDAATAYLCCSSLRKALKAYRACGHWKGVFSVAGLLELGKEEILQIANELCEELQALGKPAEAARIAIEYCGDVSTGIGYFITAREWEEALRIGLLNGREESISEIRNLALECAKTLMSEYEEGLEKVGKYLSRYLAVRQRRLLLAAKLQMEDKSMSDIDDDNVSETSSTFSGMSAYTSGTTKFSGASVSSGSTSKSRGSRRQRNKGGKIRAGSPGEEIALIEHLKGMSLSAGVQRELKSLIHALVMLGEGEAAKKLQKVVENFQLSQYAAAKLVEDTVSDEKIDENMHILEHYLHMIRDEGIYVEALSWRSIVLLPP